MNAAGLPSDLTPTFREASNEGENSFLQFKLLPFVTEENDWYDPQWLPLPVPPSWMTMQAGRQPVGVRPYADWLLEKRVGLGKLYARALMRFFAGQVHAYVRGMASGSDTEWPDGALASIMSDAINDRQPLPDAVQGFLDELERWLLHAAIARSPLMDAPVVLDALTPASWNAQCAAHLSHKQLPQYVPDIWQLLHCRGWPAIVACKTDRVAGGRSDE